MNKFFHRIQALRDKAAQVQKFIDNAPVKAAQFRDAVQATTGQLQQLRSDVQGSVAALKTDNEVSLAQILVELDQGVGVLARAGYDLTGVDLEQGLLPRAILHLERIEGARSDALETLLKESQGFRLLQGILQSLIRAESLEKTVKLSDLGFSGLIVHVGAAPTIRLCWRRNPAKDEHAIHAPPKVTLPPPLPAKGGAAPTAPLPSYGQESFFAKEAVSTTAATPEGHAPGAVPAATENPSLAPTRSPYARSVPKPADALGAKDPLARFKKMPNLSK